METSPSGIISQRNDRITGWQLNPDNPAMEAFSRNFEDKTKSLISLLSADLPVSQPTFVVEKSGALGYLPPPERRAIVSKDMRGESYVPQRIYHEEMPTGRKEKIIDEVRFELLAIVDAGTHLTNQYNTLLLSISALHSLVGSSNYLIRSQADGIDIRAKKMGGDLIIMSEGAMGNYDFKILPLNTQKEISHAVAFCHSQLLNVLKFSPQVVPDLFTVARAKANKQIQDVFANRSGRMTLPVLVGFENRRLDKKNIFFPAFRFSGPLAAHPFLWTDRTIRIEGFVPAPKPSWRNESWEALDSMEISNTGDLSTLRERNMAAREGREQEETGNKTEEMEDDNGG